MTMSAPRIEDTEAELARRFMLDFVLATYPGYLAGWFHRTLCEALEHFLADVEARLSPRLMIFAPPRHGKSEIVSRRFPAWGLGRNPDLGFISASHSFPLAKRMNRDCQRIIDHPVYAQIFPGTMINSRNVRNDATDGDSKGALRNTEEFEVIGRRGGYRCAGVGGGISGFGADILIVDDPFRNRKDADSRNVRETVWDWFTQDAMTRLAPGGGVLLMHTRWHMDDLAGRLLTKAKEGESEDWKVISYPAIAEHDEPHRKAGEALHPERYDEASLARRKAAMGTRGWMSLYQQSPIATEGALFRREWFGIVDVAPKCASIVRHWDRAATEKKSTSDPDWTAGVKIGRTRDGQLFILDVVRFRGSPLDVRRRMLNVAQQDGRHVRISIEQEPGAAGVADAADTVRHLAGFDVRISKTSTSKELRASPLSAQAEAGNVRVVRGLWNAAFLDEIEQFPGGRFDDQVDAAAGAFECLCERIDFAPDYPASSVKSSAPLGGYF